eukprot:3359623-Rhodomonas_salina.1
MALIQSAERSAALQKKAVGSLQSSLRHHDLSPLEIGSRVPPGFYRDCQWAVAPLKRASANFDLSTFQGTLVLCPYIFKFVVPGYSSNTTESLFNCRYLLNCPTKMKYFIRVTAAKLSMSRWARTVP